MEKIQLKVAGMSCQHCEKAVVNILLDIGAEAVTADAKSGLVDVEFDPTHLTVDVIKKEIFDEGYEVV